MLKRFIGHFTQKRHLAKVLGDMWDKEIQRIGEIELRYKCKFCVVSKYMGYSSILLRDRVIDHYYELKLTDFIDQKVDRWNKGLIEDAREKRLLRIRALLSEFHDMMQRMERPKDSHVVQE